MQKLTIVTSQTFTEIRCPGCGTTRAESLTLITPEIRCAPVLGVTEGGQILVSEDAETNDFPASQTLPPHWLFCSCGKDFPLPPGALIRVGPKTLATTTDPRLREKTRLSADAAAIPIPLERTKAA